MPLNMRWAFPLDFVAEMPALSEIEISGGEITESTAHTSSEYEQVLLRLVRLRLIMRGPIPNQILLRRAAISSIRQIFTTDLRYETIQSLITSLAGDVDLEIRVHRSPDEPEPGPRLTLCYSDLNPLPTHRCSRTFEIPLNLVDTLYATPHPEGALWTGLEIPDVRNRIRSVSVGAIVWLKLASRITALPACRHIALYIDPEVSLQQLRATFPTFPALGTLEIHSGGSDVLRFAATELKMF
ncbi:hypothetical protein EXIGLDRAFT_716603, partial [Exidia glandulosa HHB12029]